MAPIFSAGGLASGLDSSSIIEQLVTLESRPITVIKERQTALRAQISILGDMATKLEALKKAADALGGGGALASKATTASKAFVATAGTGANMGRFGIEVETLATAAKARSQAFSSGTSEVTAGTLQLAIKGQNYEVEIEQGATLADVAYSINALGAPVNAAVLSDGTNSYLSITTRDTGFTLGEPASSALTLTENSTGSSGQSLGASVFSPATNAKVHVDGLTFERQSNEITDILPGVSLSLQSTSTSAEDLVVSNDLEGTAAKVQTFVDAYNTIARVVQGQLAVSEGTRRSSTLAGDSAVRGLQQSLQRLISNPAAGSTSVRALSDLGIKTGRDGSLTLDKDTLQKAVTRDPAGVNALFSTPTTGLSAATQLLVKKQTESSEGILSSRKKSLTENISKLDDDAVRAQARVDAFRANLVRQYTAMETVVSGLKAMGTFLTQQSALAVKTES